LLVAEEGTGAGDNSAGVSLITPDGQIGRLVSGLRSGRDSGDLSGVPLVAVSPEGRTLYLGNFGQGHLWTLPLDDAGVLSVPEAAFTVDQLAPAMQPLNNVRLTNPFDITFDRDGTPVVTDASGNGVAQQNPDGTTRFLHRFAELKDPADARVTIDAVPTGITRIGAEYYVTLTGGCPYPEGSGRLVAIDENRNQRTVLDGLNMPIDVAQDPDGTIWVLEFARFTPGASCFTGEGYQANSGRLSRIQAGGTLQPALTDLNFPGAILPMPDGSLYISEVFAGRVLHVAFDPARQKPVATGLQAPGTEAVTATATAGSNWQFTNVAADIGLDFRHGAFRTAVYEDPVAMMGAGLCWLDYDNDGWLDLYLVNSYAEAEEEDWRGQGNRSQNALYHNEQGAFRDISGASGANVSLRGNGCIAADFNQDGWTDIYVTADGPNMLLWNNGDGTFREGAAEAGVAAPEWNSAAAAGDLNGDGWPDLFVAAYINLEHKIPKPSGAFPQDYYGLPDRLYLSNGPDGSGRVTFREVTAAAGLAREERGLGALFSDLDRDGDLDLYIANDGHPNRLYANEPWPGGVAADPDNLGFRFVDLTDTAEAGDSGSGMGIAGGDYDSDGLFDLLVTNWHDELNALYRNQSAEAGMINFRYSTYRIGISGLGNNMTGWGTAWADFDHDTDLDLLVANGHVPISDLEADAELVRLYGNRLVEGEPGQFREWTEQVGLKAIGPLLARGSAVADFDNDGDLDVAINTIGGRVALLRNDSPAGNWLQIGFYGFYPGAVATVTLPDGRQLHREWQAGSSYLSSEDPRLHFGLGDATLIPRVMVRWPNGRSVEMTDVTANQRFSLPPPAP
ncbi:MAG TPA: ScyD/ScyE family protein, partial [Anaerolineae bacterium]